MSSQVDCLARFCLGARLERSLCVVAMQVRNKLLAAVQLDQIDSQSQSVLATEIAYLQQQWQELPELGAA